MSYALVTDLPEAVRRALTAVSYGRKDIEVKASATVVLGDSGAGNGRQSFAVLVNLTTGEHTVSRGSWGGENMFVRDNAVDSDRNAYPLPGDGVAITGVRGGGQPVWAQLHIPASMVDRMLPGPTVALSDVQLTALYCHKALKGGAYRRDALSRANIGPDVIDALVSAGLLSRNRAGAVAITTDGRNALGDFRAYV
jgi:hypothetical protein